MVLYQMEKSIRIDVPEHVLCPTRPPNDEGINLCGVAENERCDGFGV